MLANTDMTGCALTTDRHRTAAPVEPGRQHFPDRGVDGAVAERIVAAADLSRMTADAADRAFPVAAARMRFSDCVPRVIAIATQRPYREVHDALTAAAVPHAATADTDWGKWARRRGSFRAFHADHGVHRRFGLADCGQQYCILLRQLLSFMETEGSWL